MSPVHAIVVRARRILVRHRWIHWLATAAIAAAVAATVLDLIEDVERQRDSWGATVDVLVATDDVDPGDPLDSTTEWRTVPRAVAPPDAVGSDADVTSLVARQQISASEIVVGIDVTAADGALRLVPVGFLAVPVIERPASGAAVGQRVSVASDGIVISDDALVIGRADQATLVAVPADEAPVLASADGGSGVTLLLER